MKRQFKLWGTRTLAVVIIVVAAQKWGVPVYKDYVKKKVTEAYVPTAKAKKGKFVVSFHEIGTLEAEKSVPVTSEVSGKIISLVDDGVSVQAGDVIFELDTVESQRDVRNKQLALRDAQAAVDTTKADLDILKESNKTEIEKAQKQLEYEKSQQQRSEEQLEKKKRLAAEKLIPGDQVSQAELDLEAKKLAVDKSELDRRLKEKEVQSKEEQKRADVAKVEFTRDIRQMDLDEAQRNVERAIIKAPASGLVVIRKDWTPDGRRKLQEGDNVRPRQTVCTLPNLSAMLVKIQLGESDAPRIRVGVPVLIRLEAVPKKVFHGTVEEISSLATESPWWEPGATPGRKNFEVTVKVKEVDAKTLKPGMTADVEFICDTVADAVFVPLESVVEREGKMYVFVKKGGKYERVAVKIGKSNDSFVVMKKGVKAGNILALRDPTKPLEEQEAGIAKPEEAKKKEEKKAAPIPGTEAAN
ncbi:MAG: hypothetical protein A2Z18_05000 [Armatimonadetes bacterium RBG_16_58_9]|nr:MAG: hypothetical protein A2Z18_05000 [Armatimonadetes bacterium RBG_16_58_9]